MKKGDIVYWNDPEGLTSDFYKIENIEPDNDIVFIVNKHSEAEVFRYEIKPVNIKIHKGFWTRDQVARDTESVYVFGDNIQDNVNLYVPSSTQAVIRGLPNSRYIITKKNRYWNTQSFLTDKDLELFTQYLELTIVMLHLDLLTGKTIIFPEQGLGTGKAMLKEKAPACWEYLCKGLKEEFDYDNGQNRENYQ